MELIESLVSDNVNKFLQKQLRFPNMKITVVDETNARNNQDRVMSRIYKKKVGIPTLEEKKKILSKWQAVLEGLDGIDDKGLDSHLMTLHE